ncbi:MAG TPA: PAS domain-containing protein [Stellaceae bacterium]|nr:PAS domain-containing protein [Stellaceae bacterium]
MDDIIHPKLQRLYEYWAGKRGGRRMPSRADLDPLDMAFIFGNVILVDVIDENPPRFRIRLHGTKLAQRAGYELTGKMLDELPVTEFRTLARQSFTAVATSGEPLHGIRNRVIDDRFARYETVIMPLSDNGERVDKLIIGLIYDDEKP